MAFNIGRIGSVNTGGIGTIGGTGGVGTPAVSASAGVPSNLTDITNLINSLNLQAQQNANAGRIPNAPELEAQSSLNIGSQLRGELPADVVRNLAQSAAERGVAGGYAGSPNDTAAYLRALGLTSLDQQDRGQANLTSALGRNPTAPIFDPTGLIMTPYQSGQLTNQTRQLELQAQEIASQNALRDAQARSVGTADTPWWMSTPATTTSTTYITPGSLQWQQLYGNRPW